MRSARFEKWFSEYTALPLERVENMWTGDTYEDYRYFVEVCWAAWQAGLNYLLEKDND